MTLNPLALSIRAKKLGVLIRNARLAAGKSTKECADAMGVTEPELEAYELGQKSPTLPEIELLAYYLGVPVDHFWGKTALPEADKTSKLIEVKRLIQLRQRMIGLLIRISRQEAGISGVQLAHKTGFPLEMINKFELGQASLSLPELEIISSALDRPLRDFQDRQGPAGKREAQRKMVQGLMEMPPELQTFVSKPINQPYLELAQRLSEMSVEKLRAVAEGLLEITL